jgi:MbtH protein
LPADVRVTSWLAVTLEKGNAPAGPPAVEPWKENDTMSWEEREDTTIYKVVINHEEQYSIWPAHRENPLGWNDVGKSGPKQECLDYIKEVWTDMRPLSLRKKMEEMERQKQAGQETN